jgi:hypothetical protein
LQLKPYCHKIIQVEIANPGIMNFDVNSNNSIKIYFNQFPEDLKSQPHQGSFEFDITESLHSKGYDWYLHVVNETNRYEEVNFSVCFLQSNKSTNLPLPAITPIVDQKPGEKPKSTTNLPAQNPESTKPNFQLKKEPSPNEKGIQLIDDATKSKNVNDYENALKTLQNVPVNVANDLQVKVEKLKDEIFAKVFQEIRISVSNGKIDIARKFLPLLNENRSLFNEANALIEQAVMKDSTSYQNLGFLTQKTNCRFEGELAYGRCKWFEITLKDRGDFQILIDYDFRIEGEIVSSGRLQSREMYTTDEGNGIQKDWLRYLWQKAPGGQVIKFKVVHKDMGSDNKYMIDVHLYPY